MDLNGKFYLGRMLDTKQVVRTDQPLLYDPADLTTHAVVVGMTGSGKTGLCIDLLEEAALNGIPALMIDPKGDITNAMLHFPGLPAQDFQPWVNADQARRQGKTVEEAAQEASDRWQQGIKEWDIPLERIQALHSAVQYTVYTPGSESGLPVSILSSLKAPAIPWEENRELLREKIAATVTAILGLVGFQDIDPVRSREHILLANLFENAWKQGVDLDLGELILQTQNPPFQKLGVFDVNTFFPEKDRFSLAMQLNNILAAPAFQSWISGDALDIPPLLHTADGRARHTIFYIAHLPDAERMFFVSLLYSAVESWMRAQPGTDSLRLILYFDEIFGYMPPIGNPPAKQIMLRMLKQARAFGVGQVLVTQNPVDLDYKGLSNAGTWFIGKLQTDKDKQRLLDGLESATGRGLDRAEYDRMISRLGPRMFLMHNIHEQQPRPFQTRWAMNFLAGPLTRSQIPELNRLAGVVDQLPAVPSEASITLDSSLPSTLSSSLPARSARAAESKPPPSSLTRPSLPAGVAEYFLPNNLSFTQAFQAAGKPYPQQAASLGILYRPVILAQASVRFLERKYNLDTLVKKTVIVPDPDRRGFVRWEDFPAAPVEPRVLDQQPIPGSSYDMLETPFTDGKLMASLERDYQDWVYRKTDLSLRLNEALELSAGPEISQAEFLKRCAAEAREQRDAEIDKVSATFEKKIQVLQDKLAREERELTEDEVEHNQRKIEEAGTHMENLLGLFGGSRRRLSTSLSKRRMTEQAKADVQESIQSIALIKQQIAALEQEKAAALEQVNDRWGEIANQINEITITPYKKDVLLDLFGLAWLPYYQVQIGDKIEELPGYTAQ